LNLWGRIEGGMKNMKPCPECGNELEPVMSGDPFWPVVIWWCRVCKRKAFGQKLDDYLNDLREKKDD